MKLPVDHLCTGHRLQVEERLELYSEAEREGCAESRAIGSSWEYPSMIASLEEQQITEGL